MREAVVSGSFYEHNQDSLNKQIEFCFKNKLGAGLDALKPQKQHKEKIYSIIVPHAGYAFSGPCATHAYAELLKNIKEDAKEEKTFIILGPNHTGQSESFFSLSLEDFETPLGIIKNNTDFSLALIKQDKFKIIKKDETAHEQEHSIEVQLPFLQYCLKKFKIVPIVCSTQDYEKVISLSRILVETIKKQKNPENFIILASSDLTHYGPNYGFVPFAFDKETKNKLYALDKGIIDQIIKLDSKSFFEKAKKSTVCGLSPITIAIESSKLLGAKQVKLLKYYSSGDIIQDYENSVGYASLVIE